MYWLTNTYILLLLFSDDILIGQYILLLLSKDILVDQYILLCLSDDLWCFVSFIGDKGNYGNLICTMLFVCCFPKPTTTANPVKHFPPNNTYSKASYLTKIQPDNKLNEEYRAWRFPDAPAYGCPEKFIKVRITGAFLERAHILTRQKKPTHTCGSHDVDIFRVEP